MTYHDFKAAAYRYKYETAIETEYARVSYGELLNRVNALYNSFCQMGAAGKTVAVLTGNCPETVYAILASIKAGCRCVLCRVSGPVSRLLQKLSVYHPSVAVVHGCHFAHTAPVLSKIGCSCAIVTENADIVKEVLPSVHFLSELLEINDYTAVTGEYGEGSVVLANDGVHFDTREAISGLARRDGVYIGLPLYCGAGFDSLFYALLSGHKCVFCQSPSAQFFRKKNVKLALIYEGAPAFDAAALFYKNDNTICINCEFVYTEECEKLISTAIGYPVTLGFDGKKIKITVTLLENSDIKSVAGSPLSHAVANVAADAFYGIGCQKSVVFKKTV